MECTGPGLDQPLRGSAMGCSVYWLYWACHLLGRQGAGRFMGWATQDCCPGLELGSIWPGLAMG